MLIKPAIITDFDGTATNEDSLSLLLDKYGSEDWYRFEDKYESGAITGSEALESEMNLLDIPLKKAKEFILESIEITPEFIEFARYCRAEQIPVQIVSCNFTQLIGAMLEKHNLSYLPVRANSLIEKDGRLVIVPGEPVHPECDDCHHCKLFAVQEQRERGFYTIYCGDGLTDRCAAWEADYLFARKRLSKWFDKSNLRYQKLDSFKSVEEYLRQILSGNKDPVSFYLADGRSRKSNIFESQLVKTRKRNIT